MSPIPHTPRNDAIMIAREIISRAPIYLDTETTGLNRSDEIVEVGIIDESEQIVFESYVRPSQPIPPGAQAVHGISNEDVKDSPTWPELWPQLRPVLLDKLIAVYNAEFDMKMLRQSHERYKLPWKDNIKAVCIMQLYAQYKGEWDSNRRSYRYHSLDKAGKECKIDIPNAHRASTDALLARALLHYMADTELAK